MATNPLFSGALGSTKQPNTFYNSSGMNPSNVLRQTNMNAGNSSDADTPLRKKPRLAGSTGSHVDAMNDSDLWNDEMIVDDEMLRACDLMESQATQSSKPPPAMPVTKTRNDGVGKKASREFPSSRTNSSIANRANNNAPHRSHSTPPYAVPGTSTSAQAGNRFTFKHSQTGSRVATANSQSFQRQSNVNYASTKVYYQPPSPTLSGGGTPPKNNSQSRSRNNSGGSATPIKLTDTPKNTRDSKVQSNVAFPKALPTNQQHFKPSSSSSTSAAASTSASTSGAANGLHRQQGHPANQIGRKQQSATTSTNTRVAASNLTPPAGSTATRESPDLPTSTQGDGGASSKAPTVFQQQLDKMRSESETYKRQLKAIKEERYSKDGEIKVLRQNLAKAKSEVSKLSMEKVQTDARVKRDQTIKEKELAKELEQLRTQLEFKNVELREAQDSYRNLDRRFQAPGSDTPANFPSLSQVTPPRRSLRVALGSSHVKAEAKSPKGGAAGGDIFPTQESFMENNHSGTKNSPKIKTHRSSPRRMPLLNLSSPGKDTHDIPSSQMFTPGAACATPMKANPQPAIATGPILCTRLQKGQSTGTQLLGKLLEEPMRRRQTPPMDGSDGGADKHGGGGGVGLLVLFQQDAILNAVYSSTGDRNSGKLSPPPAKRSPSSKSISPWQPSTNENEEIALRSLRTILNPHPATTTSDVNHRHDNDQNTTDALLGLLPLIEDRLGQYLDGVLSLAAACDIRVASSSTNPSTSSTFTRSSSVECSSDSLSSSSSGEDNWALASLEIAAVSGLHTLGQMVCHSDAVCRTLLSGGGASGSAGSRVVVVEERNDDGDISAIEIDPSAPLIDPTQAPGRQLDYFNSSLSHCRSKIQMMSKLIKLASIQPSSASSSQQHAATGSPPRGSVIEATLRVLTVLARKAEIQELDRFRLLLINDSLSVNLTTDSSLQRTCSSLDIMSAMCRSPDLLKRFCNQSDDCQLLHIYQCGLRGIKTGTDSQTTAITSKVIDLLLNIVNSHNSGATFLLGTDCQCSMEVIHAVLLMLHREYRIYTQRKDSAGFSLLRQGVMLLHCLATCTDHKLDIEHIQLIICLTRLFRRLPEATEAEANLLLDLWDFEEDDEEDAAHQEDMEVDS